MVFIERVIRSFTPPEITILLCQMTERPLTSIGPGDPVTTTSTSLKYEPPIIFLLDDASIPWSIISNSDSLSCTHVACDTVPTNFCKTSLPSILNTTSRLETATSNGDRVNERPLSSLLGAKNDIFCSKEVPKSKFLEFSPSVKIV